MFQFSTAHWCERSIGAASGQAGPEVWPSRTHVQIGKRLAAYGDFATIEKHATSISILLQPSLTNTFVPKVFSVGPKHTSFVMQCDQRI